MTINNIIKNICKKLGESPKATYSMVAIATANGIFRPTFTMMKKGEEPHSKRYAALREGLTEAFAVPTYIACGEIGSKLGKYIGGKAKEIELQKLEKAGKTFTQEIKEEMINAAKKKGASGLNLIAICVAAGLVIPSLCSVCVTPIMRKVGPRQLTATKQPTQIFPPNNQINRPVFKNMSYSGMKVGGV